MDARHSDEKYEKEREKEEEKAREKEEKSWEEKWRHDPVGTAVWAVILIWAGLVLLAGNLELLKGLDAWGLIFTGASVLVFLGVAFRLLVPAYRRPVGGTLIWAAILLGIGLGNLLEASITWPLILIAVGLGLLLRGLFRDI